MTRERRTIRDLKKKIESLESQIRKLENDRNLFREHFQKRYEWFWKLLEGNDAPNMKWLLQNDSMWLRRFEYWSF
jgi:hypothetical protein